MNRSKVGCQEYLLPNGVAVFHLNKHETDFTYREIFQNQIYLKHGIRLNEQGCIFDVGANIGLFVLFAKQQCPDVKIFAFEPAPDVCRLLRLNVAPYGSSVRVFRCGISDEQKETTFRYYPNYSIMSGFYADARKDKETLSSSIRNQLPESIRSAGAAAAERAADVIATNKLKEMRDFKCKMRTVSSVLRDERIERISLLKIDAERSEVEVLGGIDERDWPKIHQVVMEAHDVHQSEAVIALLNAKGFKVNSEQEAQFVASGVTNIFAKRPL